MSGAGTGDGDPTEGGRPFVLVTGAPGTGKSTLCRALIKHLRGWRYPMASPAYARALRRPEGGRLPPWYGAWSLDHVERDALRAAAKRPRQVLSRFPGLESRLLAAFASADPALFTGCGQRVHDLQKVVHRLQVYQGLREHPGAPLLQEEDGFWHKLVLCEDAAPWDVVPLPDAVVVLTIDDPEVVLRWRRSRGARHDRRALSGEEAEGVEQVRRQDCAWRKVIEVCRQQAVPVQAVRLGGGDEDQAISLARWLVEVTGAAGFKRKEF